MSYERESYMRRQDAEHDMIRMRDPRCDVRNRFRDRDASLAEDAKRLSPEGVAARPEGIAHPQPVGSETATDAAKREGENEPT